ncbi:MAG: hypothetical protein LWX07_04145 [Bacteroidetes bacterium]|nr:hypothetical protein [Bacteroidota bacterium]
MKNGKQKSTKETNIQSITVVKSDSDLNERFIRMADLCRALTGYFLTGDIFSFFGNLSFTGYRDNDNAIRGFGSVMNLFSEYVRNNLDKLTLDYAYQKENEDVNVQEIYSQVKRYASIIKGYSRCEDIAELTDKAKFENTDERKAVDSFLSCLNWFNEEIGSTLENLVRPETKVS